MKSYENFLKSYENAKNDFFLEFPYIWIKWASDGWSSEAGWCDGGIDHDADGDVSHGVNWFLRKVEIVPKPKSEYLQRMRRLFPDFDQWDFEKQISMMGEDDEE